MRGWIPGDVVKSSDTHWTIRKCHGFRTKVRRLGANLLVETLIKLDRGEIVAIPQDNTLATYAPLIKDDDYDLDWSKSAIALHNQIRAFHSNCITSFQEKPLKVCATVPLAPEYHPQFPPEYQNLLQQWRIYLNFQDNPER